MDLFAGVGGFRRGMEIAGHQCVGFCEADKYATASYTAMHLLTDADNRRISALPRKARLNEILKEEYRGNEWYSSDIRAVRGRDLPTVGMWCAGTPCQNFSIARERTGLRGEKSSLIGELFRLLHEIEESDRPEWIVLENVKGMLTSNGGWDFAAVLSEMDDCGYDTEWRVFNSKDFGVPQNRERVYVVGHFRKYGGVREKYYLTQSQISKMVFV